MESHAQYNPDGLKALQARGNKFIQAFFLNHFHIFFKNKRWLSESFITAPFIQIERLHLFSFSSCLTLLLRSLYCSLRWCHSARTHAIFKVLRKHHDVRPHEIIAFTLKKLNKKWPQAGLSGLLSCSPCNCNFPDHTSFPAASLRLFTANGTKQPPKVL